MEFQVFSCNIVSALAISNKSHSIYHVIFPSSFVLPKSPGKSCTFWLRRGAEARLSSRIILEERRAVQRHSQVDKIFNLFPIREEEPGSRSDPVPETERGGQRRVNFGAVQHEKLHDWDDQASTEPESSSGMADASSSSSEWLSISIGDDTEYGSCISHDLDPETAAELELLRSVALFEQLELAIVHRHREAARKINLRIKELGARHSVKHHPERLGRLKQLMRNRGFTDAKMTDLQQKFDQLDRTGSVSSSWFGRSSTLDSDPFLLESVALFARMEIAILRRDFETAKKVKAKITNVGKKYGVNDNQERMNALKQSLISRGFTQQKMSDLDTKYRIMEELQRNAHDGEC